MKKELSSKLSEGQLQVLALIAQGKTTKEIAIILGLPYETVKSRINGKNEYGQSRGIFTKLKVVDRTAAVMAAARSGQYYIHDPGEE